MTRLFQRLGLRRVSATPTKLSASAGYSGRRHPRVLRRPKHLWLLIVANTLREREYLEVCDNALLQDSLQHPDLLFPQILTLALLLEEF